MRAALLVLLGALGAAPAQAQTSPLTLEEVLQSAERHYPLLDAARADQDAAHGELLAARGGFDPLLRARGAGTFLGYYENYRADVVLEQPTPLWGATLFGGWRLGLGTFPEYDGKLATNQYGEVRGGVSVPLWRNGPIDRRRANLRRAELGLPIADLSLQQQRLEVRRQAAVRYAEWVAAGQRLRIAKDLLRIARERDSALQARVRGGDLPAYERTDNQRALVQREGLLISAERALQQAAIELSLFLRRPDGSPLVPLPARLPPGLPAVPTPAAQPEADVERALRGRPELRRLLAQRRREEIERDLARNQQAPAVDVSVAASRDLGPGDPVRDKTELEVAVLLDVPLLMRAARGRTQAQEAQVRRVSAQQRLAVDRVTADVNDARSALQAARERLDAAQRERRLAQELEVAERERFGLGDSSLLFVNLREQAAAEAAGRVVDALLDGHRAYAAYQAAVAAGLDGGGG